MNTTIKDLARELDLSVATISKALKDSYEISPETKQRVIDLANKLNYSPNPYASSLRKGKSKTIAVVLPEVADSYFSQAINGIEAVAQEKGFHVLVYLTHENVEREKSILKDLSNGRVDGVLMSVCSNAIDGDHVAELCDDGMPLVFFDRVNENIQKTKVLTNDEEAGFLATQHLLDSGCKRIAFLAMDKALSITSDRLNGFKRALKTNDEKEKDHLVITCGADEKNCSKQLAKTLSGKHAPDGVIASVEKLSLTVYSVCKELKIKIPDELKVVSFSNLQFAELLNPALTTITQPAFAMGEAAAQQLFDVLDKSDDEADEKIIIPSVLIERESTKATKKKK